MGWTKLTFVVLPGALVVGAAGARRRKSDKPIDGWTVTVGHEFGSTTVSGTPTRVAAASNQFLGVLLEPVGYLSAGRTGDDRGR
ncbi:ABC-type Fe3+-citrate transport system substrate-binding protein [Rhodococcus sp. 27YEA15]|uniref:hypothetical protein n=1 Tax=Rhodococcus sp. 27YEA15 TaxID=3156259 RepID=UPI003C79E17B